MTPSVFLFGTSHSLQCGAGAYTDDTVDEFRTYIRDICQSEDIAIIIEEWSQGGSAHYEVSSTIAAGVAKDLSLHHSYVDLDSGDRAKLRISDADLVGMAMRLSPDGNTGMVRDDLVNRLSSPIRERYWVASILENDVWPTLFICGSSHVANVASPLGGIVERIVIVEYDYDPKDGTLP